MWRDINSFSFHRLVHFTRRRNRYQGKFEIARALGLGDYGRSLPGSRQYSSGNIRQLMEYACRKSRQAVSSINFGWIGLQSAKEKAGIPDDSSLCETGSHLEDILQTYKKIYCLTKAKTFEKKRAINTTSIIGGVITFASTFFEIIQFFTNFLIFWLFAVQALLTSAFFASSDRFERQPGQPRSRNFAYRP